VQRLRCGYPSRPSVMAASCQVSGLGLQNRAKVWDDGFVADVFKHANCIDSEEQRETL